MKKTFSILMCGLLLAGCAQNQQTTQPEPETQQTTETQTGTDSTETTKDDEFDIDGETIKTGKTELDSITKPVKITSQGTYDLTGHGTTVIIDAKKQDVTLNLDNVTLNGGNLPAIYVKKAASVTINLTGDNKMTYDANPTYETLDACLYSKADLVMDGTGTLDIESSYEHGIKAKDTAIFKNGTYKINAQNDGIHVNEDATFENGTYTINVDGEGIESKTNLTINDGTYSINARDDAINAIESLTVNGGTITAISANNDGIDSNGDMVFNGGNITAIGANAPETAFDVDNTPFEIKGGTLFGIGSTATMPTDVSQPAVWIGTQGTPQTIQVKQNGETILDLQAPEYTGMPSCIFLSSDKLQAGQTYEFYVNGTLIDESELSEGVTTIGNVQTMGGGQQPGGPMGNQGMEPGGKGPGMGKPRF